MGFRKALYGAGLGVASLAALYAFQRPFRQFAGVEYCDGVSRKKGDKLGRSAQWSDNCRKCRVTRSGDAPF
jgi:hypothetical protein